jgi:hypothetical protein
MYETDPVRLMLYYKILEFLRKNIHIQTMGKKTRLDNKKTTWRLNIDISLYREPIRR